MAQPKEIYQPLVTSNERIRRVYGENSTIPNVEYTLPAGTITKYEAPVMYDDPSLHQAVMDSLRVIVLPETYRKLDPETRKKVQVMSSTYECGRVLERDQTVMIDGVEHTINVKGVGATTFVRNGNIAFSLMTSMNDRLRTYPFYQSYGELDLSKAMAESSAAVDLKSQGIDTERVLGVYKIVSMPDQNGEYVNPAVLREEGYLVKDTTLLARASKSNFRLLDSVTMFEKRMHMYIPGLRELVLEQFATTQAEPADMQTYLRFLTEKLYRQEMPLITQGYEMCAGKTRWRNLARNISVLGEELDLEGIEPNRDFQNPHAIFDYQEHVYIQITNLDNTIRAFADTISFDGPKTDFGSLALFVWEGISGSLSKLDLPAILDSMSSTIRRRLNYTGPESLFRGIFGTIEGAYRHAIYLDSYRTPTRDGAWVYKNAMVDHFDKERKALFGK